MRTQMLIAFLSSAILSVCHAAPAPFPKPESSAEVVFDATTAERARLIAAYLRSWAFAQKLADSPAGKEHLVHLKTLQQRRDWFSDRLRVTQDGKLIRVRLEHRFAPLAALRLVTGHLVSPADELADEPPVQQQMRRLLAAMRRQELMARLDQMRRGARKATAEQMEEMAAQAGRYEIEGNPLKLHAAPRDVGRVR